MRTFKLSRNPYFFIIAILGLSILMSQTGTVLAAPVKDEAPTPRLWVRENENSVIGVDWGLGSLVTLTIDDPDNGPGVDYTATKTVEPWGGNHQTRVRFGLWGEYDLKAGDEVSLTDGNITKTHIVTALQLRYINIYTDNVTGFAASGSLVELWICGDEYCSSREAIADEEGNWTANFRLPGNMGFDEEPFDIVPGTWVESAQWDEDSNFTVGTVAGDYALTPRLWVRENENRVIGVDWGLGSPVTLTIDDPDNGPGVDYTATKTVEPWGGNHQTVVRFALWNEYDLKAGDIVILTDDNGITQTHTVTALKLTYINTFTDVVTGTAEPGSRVELWACDEENNCGSREAFADSDGKWSANFRLPGTLGYEEEPFDILPDTWVESAQWEIEGVVGTVVGDYATDPIIWVENNTIIIDGKDTGVENLELADGTTLADLLSTDAANATNHGEFVNAIVGLANQWKKDGLISGKDQGSLVSSSGGATAP